MLREMRRYTQAGTAETCAEILKTEKRGVLSVIGDGGYPYAVPLDFYYEEEEQMIYFHCASGGHVSAAVYDGGRVCRAELIEDAAQTSEIVRKLAMKYYPTEEEVDAEMEKAIARVQLLSLHIEHMTGKLVNER